jgi:hypothetical protein
MSFLFKVFRWIWDMCVFLLRGLWDMCILVTELTESAIINFLRFLVTALIDFLRWLPYVIFCMVTKTPYVEKPFEGSFIMRTLRKLGTFFWWVLMMVIVLCVSPELRWAIFTLGTLFRMPTMQVVGFVSLLFIMLPHQRRFRDPISRKFFHTGLFKKYPDAVFLAKVFSLLFATMVTWGTWGGFS